LAGHAVCITVALQVQQPLYFLNTTVPVDWVALLHHIKVYYSPTNAQVIVKKDNIKVYIKIALTCFGAVTPSSGRSLKAP